MRQELAQIQKEKGETLQQRLFIRVLDLSGKTGELSSYDPATPTQPNVKITSADAAGALIRRHQREAGDRELYYLFLFPRPDTGFPTDRQFEQYKRWFGGGDADKRQDSM